jgi:hypothetical protein
VKLEAAIDSYRNLEALQWSRSEPSLEDVFIDRMGRAKDNPISSTAPWSSERWGRTRAMLIKEMIQLRRMA